MKSDDGSVNELSDDGSVNELLDKLIDALGEETWKGAMKKAKKLMELRKIIVGNPYFGLEKRYVDSLKEKDEKN